jgi:hypothetical protein
VESNLLLRAWGQGIDRGTPGIITTCNVDLPCGEKERTARNAENDYILEIVSQHREQAQLKFALVYRFRFTRLPRCPDQKVDGRGTDAIPIILKLLAFPRNFLQLPFLLKVTT